MRDWDSLYRRAMARRMLGGPSEMQVPRSRVSSAELLRQAVLDPTALGQSHGPQEDTVNNTAVTALGPSPDAPTRKQRAHEVRKYRLRTVIIMTFVGIVIGGFAGWGIVYYRDWWFSDELMTTRAFLVPMSIVVGFILFLVLFKFPQRLIRRSRRKSQRLDDALAEIRELKQSIGASTPHYDDRPPPPAPVRVAPDPDPDPALITRAVPASRPAHVRGGPSHRGVLRTTMGDDRQPQVGDTRPAPVPIDLVSDPAPAADDDDDFDVPSFLK